MSKIKSETPVVFISYSWTSQDYENQVLDLGTRLTESGVKVYLDKWDLREGADINKYMEKIATDHSINKVLILCDSAYAQKASDRKGGVGTETLIITPEIYNQLDPAGDEQRFIPVIMERYENGEACCPVFLKGRNYIDMSSMDLYEANFEKLLRVIFNKPRYKRPELGSPPAFIESGEAVSLGSLTKHRFALNALRDGKPNAIGACRDYFDSVVRNLERFRVNAKEGEEIDDIIVQSIEFLEEPKEELAEMFQYMIRNGNSQETSVVLHSFFEMLFPYTQAPKGNTDWEEIESENYRFFIHEIFLYAVAIALKENKFEIVAYLLKDYYLRNESSLNRGSMQSYTDFCFSIRSLDSVRNKRLSLGRISLHSDMIHKRADVSKLINSNQLMQADFVVFIHYNIRQYETITPRWFPVTLLYAANIWTPFEIFARAQSRDFFNKLKVALNISRESELIEISKLFANGKRMLPRWETYSFSIVKLAGLDLIASKP